MAHKVTKFLEKDAEDPSVHKVMRAFDDLVAVIEDAHVKAGGTSPVLLQLSAWDDAADCEVLSPPGRFRFSASKATMHTLIEAALYPAACCRRVKPGQEDWRLSEAPISATVLIALHVV
jgi:hypothetical protein